MPVGLFVVKRTQCKWQKLFIAFLQTCIFVFDRFRAGFKQAFRWCPCVTTSSYEGLELKSTRYLQTQTSVYKASRMETTVSAVLPPAEDAAKAGAKRSSPVHSPSLELASNGSSSRSMSKTVSETSSFYSSNNLPA